MEINFKDYNLEYFKEKDLYTWEEVISIIENMEGIIHELQEKIEEIEREPEEPDMHEDYVLGLI